MSDSYTKSESRKAQQVTKPRCVLLAMVLVFASAVNSQPAAALTHGMVDTFTSGTTEGWVSAAVNPTPPVVVLSGGPMGTGDAYVSVSSLGCPPGTVLTAFNTTQWAGDYLSAGVTAFKLDCLNAGRSALIIRIVVAHLAPTTQATDAVVSKPIVLPPGKGWVSVVVSLAPNNLTTLVGSASRALANATEVRIIHGAGPAFPPAAITGTLGIDNFQAISAPVSTQAASWARVKGLYR